MAAPPRRRDEARARGPLLGRLDAALPFQVAVWHVLVAIVLLAILARVVFLGHRIAHWDEARVAYWIDHYADAGSFAYRRIIHGPFIQHLNRWVFTLLGANDFFMRLPVAIIGGLLPLTAWLFREHLEDEELLALALFLAANAILVYYSRFMRSDILVAAFMFGAFGFIVRLYDTLQFRYLYAASACIALGFASKENAVVYLLTWVGATVVLADQALYRPREFESGWALLVANFWGLVRTLRPLVTPTVGLGVFVAVAVGAWVSAEPLALVLYVVFTAAVSVAFRVVEWMGSGEPVTRPLARSWPGRLTVWILERFATEAGEGSNGSEPRGDGNRQGTKRSDTPAGPFAESGDNTGDTTPSEDTRPGEAADTTLAADAATSWAKLRYLAHPVGAIGLFLAIIVFMYAPRGSGMEGLLFSPDPARASVGFWQALGDPAALSDLVSSTLSDTVEQFVEWFGQTSEPGCRKDTVTAGYVCYLQEFLKVLVVTGGVLFAFAIIGFVWERYGRRTSRNLVLFAAMGGFVSVLGYPLGTDVFGAWIVAHAVVPLAIPAAVGLARIYRWGRQSVDAGDAVGTTLAVLLLSAAAFQVAFVNLDSVYTNDQSAENQLVQFAQPTDDFRPTVRTVFDAAGEQDPGPDLLVYYGANGGSYDDREALVKRSIGGNASGLAYRPNCVKWFNILPIPWYYTRADAAVTCARASQDLRAAVEEAAPGIVLVSEGDQTVPEEFLSQEYEPRTYEMRAPGREMTFWVHERLLDGRASGG